jgi:fumarate hydratase subunit beta
MSEVIKIKTPLSEDAVRGLRAGDMVELSGVIYSARDSAHKRMIEALDKGEDLPCDIQGAVIYYMGPTPPPPGKVIGSAGPTTSGRMDAYAPRLIAQGLSGMIGKGNRSQEVIDACKEHGAVYFSAIGGAGALISGSIKSARVIAYEELGPEALRELEVKAMPVVVINDTEGRDLYDEGRKKYETK